MFRFLVILLIPTISFCQGIKKNSNKVDKNQIANDSISITRLINLADSIYNEDVWRSSYPELYRKIEKIYLSNTELTNTLKNEITYKLADFYDCLFYDFVDSCSFGQKAYDYYMKCDSVEYASEVLLLLTQCKNVYNNEYNESISLILNQFACLDSVSNDLFRDFNDDIIWSLKNNLGVSYYNSNQLEKAKKIQQELIFEISRLDTSELFLFKEDYELMTLINYGNTLHKLKEFNKSIELLYSALKIIDSLVNPNDYMFADKFVIQRNLANIYISTLDFDNALRFLDEAQKVAPDSIWNAIIFFDKAKIQSKQNKYKNAIHSLKNSIKYFDKSNNYMLVDAKHLLFKNYLKIKSKLALDVLDDLINDKIKILKKNECFLPSEVNLISQAEILELIHYHINLNNNKIKNDYWFFIKNRDLSLDYNFYGQLDSVNKDKVLKLKEQQSKLYSLQQKSFIENDDKINYSNLISEIESNFTNINKKNSCNKVYDDSIIKNLLNDNEVLVDIAKIPILNNSSLSKDTHKYYALIVEKNKPTRQIYIGSSDSLNLSYSLYESYIQGISKKIELNSMIYDNIFSVIDASVDFNKEIIFFPEGVYNFINPLTLFNKNLNKYVIDYRIISNINNLNDLNFKGNSVKKYNSITLFYDPLFNDNSPNKSISYTSKNRTIRGGQISPLPGTKIEGELIQKICKRKNIKVDSYSGIEASEENFKSTKLGNIVHFATHGYYFNEYDHQLFFSIDTSKYINPYLLTGLLLTRSENTLKNDYKYFENGWLTGLEIQALDFSNVNLIILSACETMIGKEINGRGVFGLSHSIKKAGGKNIISSLWKVDDNATKDLMTNFYENLYNNSDIRELLKSTILTLRKKYPHPYYWGPFIYQY